VARPRSQSVDEVAAIRAEQAQAAEYAEIAATQASAQRRADQAAADAQARARAVADYNRSIAPQVEGAYAGAAERTAAFGKGFADGMRMVEQGSAGEANALLAKHGSPQQVGAPSAGDPLYATGGYIPATTLNREGAAFTSAAAMLPATAMGVGQQQVGGIYKDLALGLQDLEDRRLGLAAARPKLLSDERTAIRERNFQREQFAETKRQNRANAQLQWASVRTNAEYLGVSKDKMLMEEAAFLTNQTGELHIVKKGRVVPTGKVASGSDAYGQVARASAATGGSAKDKKAARAKAIANRGDALKTASGALRDASTDWAGKPIENPKAGSLLNPGKYLDKRGKGTNDPNKAAQEGGLSWPQMVNRAMQMEEVQQLVTRYGYSRSKARAKVVAWLRSLGFTPPVPKPKPPRLSEGARNAPQ
jgi:hypothetical protein